MFPDGGTILDVLVSDRFGSSKRDLRPLLGLKGEQDCSHPIESPSQIRGGGTGRKKGFVGMFKSFVTRVHQHGKSDAVTGGGTDQWCAAYAHIADAGHDIGGGPPLHGFKPMR